MPPVDDALSRTDRGSASATAGPPARSGTAGRGDLRSRLRRFLGGGTPDRRRIERFLAQNRFPLVEHDAVTFAFHGEADAVHLRHFMAGVPNGQAFERLPGTDLWRLSLPLPPGTRFEYKLDVVRDGHGEWINDPLNPETASDPFGANSVGHSFGYEPAAWTDPAPGAPAGALDEMTVESRAFGEARNLRVYLPAGFAADRAYPVVIFHDGEDFVNHAGLTTVLDNLIHRGEVPPFVAALSQPGERNGEYTGDPRHADFLTVELLPALRERFPLRADPAGTVLMGSSLGAVASLSTAFRHPGVYGALALKSGSFIFDRRLLESRDPLFGRIADFVDRMVEEPGRLPRRIFIGCGVYEGLIGQNRALARYLRAQGAEVRVVETRDAHHWQNWRDQLRASLRWTLPRDR